MEERERPADVAGVAAQQVQLLLGRADGCARRASSGGSATTAPEARGNNHARPRVQQATWSSPVTSRLLLEAGLGANRIDGYGTQANLPNNNALIPVTEQCTAGCAANGGIAGLQYRGNNSYVADSDVYSWRASASFVTGRTNAKIGYQAQFDREPLSELDLERHLDQLSLQQRHPESAYA